MWGSILRRRGAEGSEGGGGVQKGRKIADERFHGGMPEAVKAKEIHLMKGLLNGPLFNGHAIGGNEDASAVLAETAMEENFLCRVIAEEREELNHLLICGRRPLIHGDVDETHTEGLDLLAFPEDFCGIFEAKIDDRVDAEFLELGQALWSWLRAAVKMISDPANIGDGRYAKFFSVGRMHYRGSGGRWIPLRGKRVRQEKETKERERKQTAFHNGLDAESVARDGKIVKALQGRRLT
jgi:hypothetical protein